jgi:hypothetical protein
VTERRVDQNRAESRLDGHDGRMELHRPLYTGYGQTKEQETDAKRAFRESQAAANEIRRKDTDRLQQQLNEWYMKKMKKNNGTVEEHTLLASVVPTESLAKGGGHAVLTLNLGPCRKFSLLRSSKVSRSSDEEEDDNGILPSSLRMVEVLAARERAMSLILPLATKYGATVLRSSAKGSASCDSVMTLHLYFAKDSQRLESSTRKKNKQKKKILLNTNNNGRVAKSQHFYRKILIQRNVDLAKEALHRAETCRALIWKSFREHPSLTKILPICFDIPNQFFPHTSERLPTSVMWNTGAAGTAVLAAGSVVSLSKQGGTDLSANTSTIAMVETAAAALSLDGINKRTFSLMNPTGLLSEIDVDSHSFEIVNKLMAVAVGQEHPLETCPGAGGGIHDQRDALGFPGVKAALRYKREVAKDCVKNDHTVLVMRLIPRQQKSEQSRQPRKTTENNWEKGILPVVEQMLMDVASGTARNKDQDEIDKVLYAMRLSMMFSEVTQSSLRQYRLGNRGHHSVAPIRTMKCMETDVMRPVRCCSSSNCLVLLNYAEQVRRTWTKQCQALMASKSKSKEATTMNGVHRVEENVDVDDDSVLREYCLEMCLCRGGGVFVSGGELHTLSGGVESNVRRLLSLSSDGLHVLRDGGVRCWMDKKCLEELRVLTIPPWKVV